MNVTFRFLPPYIQPRDPSVKLAPINPLDPATWPPFEQVKPVGKWYFDKTDHPLPSLGHAVLIEHSETGWSDAFSEYLRGLSALNTYPRQAQM